MLKKIFLLFMAVVISAAFLSCEKNDAEINVPEATEEAQIEETEIEEMPVEGGKLRLCMFGVDTLNPLVTKNKANSRILALFYDSLFKLGDNLYPEYAVCENAEISSDGLIYTLKIRSNVKFHSGENLTAEDAAFSLLLAKESGGAYAEGLKLVESAEAVGSSLKITLSQPVFNFTANLTFPVLKAEGSLLQAMSSAADYLPNGSGVYMLKEYRLNKTLYLTAVDSHYDGRLPYIKDCEIEIVKNRETAIDMLENGLSDVLPPNVVSDGEYSPKSNLKKAETNSGSFVFLGVNNQHLALLEPEMRQALSMSVDREKIVSFLSGNLEKAVIPVHPDSWLYYEMQGEDGGYNRSLAAELISSLGWTDSDDDRMLDKVIVGEKTNLYLDILINEENAERMRLAEFIKEEFSKNQIAVTITAVPFSEYNERIAGGNYDLFIGEIRFGDNQDISEFAAGAQNVFRAYKEELSVAFWTAKTAQSTNEIYNDYAAVCRELADSLPMIGICFKDDTVLINNRIKGNIKPTGSNIFANVCDWFIH